MTLSRPAGIVFMIIAIFFLVSVVAVAREVEEKDGQHYHSTEMLDQLVAKWGGLYEQLANQQAQIRKLEARVSELEEMLSRSDEVPQTNEDYARRFSIMTHEHGLLQADHYTICAERAKGRTFHLRPRREKGIK